MTRLREIIIWFKELWLDWGQLLLDLKKVMAWLRGIICWFEVVMAWLTGIITWFKGSYDLIERRRHFWQCCQFRPHGTHPMATFLEQITTWFSVGNETWHLTLVSVKEDSEQTHIASRYIWSSSRVAMTTNCEYISLSSLVNSTSPDQLDRLISTGTSLNSNPQIMVGD